MEQLSPNVFAKTSRRGSNHGFVTTSDGIVLIDGPHKPSDALRPRAEIARRGPLRYIIKLVAVSDRNLVRVGPHVHMEAACLIGGTLGSPLHAIRMARVEVGETAVPP